MFRFPQLIPMLAKKPAHVLVGDGFPGDLGYCPSDISVGQSLSEFYDEDAHRL